MSMILCILHVAQWSLMRISSSDPCRYTALVIKDYYDDVMSNYEAVPYHGVHPVLYRHAWVANEDTVSITVCTSLLCLYVQMLSYTVSITDAL